MTTRGRFITLEGIDGAGKSSHLAFLVERARERGGEAILTREPGGTPVGEKVRELVLHQALDPLAEALLMFTSRRVQVREVIEPALAAGTDVVTDRFTGSTFAYQGYGRGLPVGELRRLSSWATGGLEPDLNVLLVVSIPFGVADPLDRLEAAGIEFHRRVADGFAAPAAEDPERWVMVDGDGTVEEVAARVALVVGERLSVSL